MAGLITARHPDPSNQLGASPYGNLDRVPPQPDHRRRAPSRVATRLRPSDRATP